MAVIRQQNFLGAQRVDAPHLRALESGVAADFDLLAGRILAGKHPLVVKGFTLVTTDAIGRQASALQVNVADSIIIHHESSESGSLFAVPADRAPETLSSTNSYVVGSFTANQVNYVGLDLRRTSDSSTSDLVQFYDIDTNLETPKTVPLARTLDYRFVISVTDFSSNPNILPIAKVTTNASNVVTLIEDARQMFYRLGKGGNAPDRFYAYPWAGSRSENLTGDVFAGADKGIDSQKAWNDAVMTRLWELGGGEHWYTGTSDREVKMLSGPDVLVSTGDNFEWDLGSDTLEWSDLSFSFANSTATLNEVADGTAELADGECLYVDVDRTTNLTGGDALVPQVAELSTLGTPIVPGSRFLIAWRIGDVVFVRDRPYELGREYLVATTTTAGVVVLSGTPASLSAPKVAAIDSGNRAISRGVTTEGSAFAGTQISIGTQSADAGGVAVGKVNGTLFLKGSSILTYGPIFADGSGGPDAAFALVGHGLEASGSANYAGVRGVGGLNSVNSTRGPAGLLGYGADASGSGSERHGGAGVHGIGGAGLSTFYPAAAGGYFIGGTTSGEPTNNGVGVIGLGGGATLHAYSWFVNNYGGYFKGNGAAAIYASGDTEVTSNYKYAAGFLKACKLHVQAMSFLSNDATLTLQGSPPSQIYWASKTGTINRIFAPVQIPAGATITKVEALLGNGDGVTRSPQVSVYHRTYQSTTPGYATGLTVVNTTVNVPHNASAGVYNYYDAGAITNAVVPSDGIVFADIQLVATSTANTLFFGGLRISYTLDTVSPAL